MLSKFLIFICISVIELCRPLCNIHFCILSLLCLCSVFAGLLFMLLIFVFFVDENFLILVFCLCSTKDWKFAADQYVRMLPGKVIVHCKSPPPPCARNSNYQNICFFCFFFFFFLIPFVLSQLECWIHIKKYISNWQSKGMYYFLLHHLQKKFSTSTSANVHMPKSSKCHIQKIGLHNYANYV